jgi:hypothetical protein
VADNDPYWDFFVNHPPSTPDNLINNAIRNWSEGSVFPVKKDVHSPDVMSKHVKEMVRFFGGDGAAIARLPEGHEYPFAIVCAQRSDYDTRTALGHGGQAAVQQALFVTFNLAAVIREMGYRATAKLQDEADRVAAAVRLPALKPFTHVELVHTDLPLAADAEVAV